jgi:SAM-dependent methyltransferase
MSLKNLLRTNRQIIEENLCDSSNRHLFSPIYYSQYKVTLPLIKKFARGKLIDLGCGYMPFKDLISDKISDYHGFDISDVTGQIKYIGDIQNMSMISDNFYDTAICIEVLEHIPDPFKAIKEIFRILKPGGRFIVSVPFIARLHDEPHDYYRFTSYGLMHLLKYGNFDIVTINKRGGFFSFTGHQLSTLLLGFTWKIPILKQILWSLNSWFITRLFYKLDQITGKMGRFAIGHSAVAIKNSQE